MTEFDVVLGEFNDISGDKMATYISYSLSSSKLCDEIAVFYEGGIIQQSTNNGLLADASSKYHELWRAHAQYYTEQ